MSGKPTNEEIEQTESKRMRAEEALRESESNLRKAQALTKLGSWQFDLKTQKVFWSDEMYRIFGLDKKRGAPNWPEGHEKLFHSDDWTWARKATEEAIQDCTGYEFNDRFYQVEATLNPVKALELFQSKPDQFDLVITDMTMPQMTGVALSEKIMEIRPDMPVIICTGHSSLIDEERAKQLGIAAYVMKPINMKEIAKTIRKVFDETKSSDQQ